MSLEEQFQEKISISIQLPNQIIQKKKNRGMKHVFIVADEGHWHMQDHLEWSQMILIAP